MKLFSIFLMLILTVTIKCSQTLTESQTDYDTQSTAYDSELTDNEED